MFDSIRSTQLVDIKDVFVVLRWGNFTKQTSTIGGLFVILVGVLNIILELLDTFVFVCVGLRFGVVDLGVFSLICCFVLRFLE